MNVLYRHFNTIQVPLAMEQYVALSKCCVKNIGAPI